MAKKDTDIAIVGMSCIYPGAGNVEEYWNNLVNGVDSITDVPADRIDHEYLQYVPGAVDRFYCKKGGFIAAPVIDPAKYGILPIAAEGYDPEHIATMILAHQALEDAGVFEKNISLDKGSIILGKGNFTGLSMLRVIDIVHTAAQVAEVVKTVIPDIPDDELDKIKKNYQESKGRYRADSAIGTMPNLVASMVANKLDMHGPAYTIDGACASSLIAINHSIQYLVSGQCDIAIAGGIHLGQSAIFWSLFNMLGAMSHKDQIAPLSENADGLLIGEGAGMIILKTLDKAIADRDRIYAVIKSSAICSDGSGVSVMAPNTEGQKKAVEMAWANSGLDMGDVSYIEAHGTATVVGDRTEINTLSNLFGDKGDGKREIMVGSVKSNIGHTMPAAGMASMIKTALSLYHRKMVPTLHCEKPAKAILESRFRPVQQTMDWDESKFPLVAGVNAFGFGGVNGHVILEAYKDEKRPAAEMFPEKVIAVSAKNKEELLQKLDNGDFTLADKGDYRLILFDPTAERIEKARKLIEKDKPWRGRMDIWFSNAPLLKGGGKLAFLFPGYDPESNPEFATLSEYFGIAPRRSGAIEDNKAVEHLLNLYYNSQFLDESIKRAGVKPDMYAGHSLGEWHAIRAAGLSTDESVQRFFNSIDSTQHHKEQEMIYIAVGCGYDRISKWCEGTPNLYLANDNCPNQILLCADEKATEYISDILRREQIYFQMLDYQSGYHTPFLKDKIFHVDEAMKHIELSKNDIPVWSATSLEQYPTDMNEFRQLTADHLTTTVRFRELIEKLYDQENARVFVQMGPGGSLTGFINDTLKDKDYIAVTASDVNKTGIQQLRRVLALLFIEGRDVNREILGITQGKTYHDPKKAMKFQMSLPIVKDMPYLREAAAKYRPAGVMSSLEGLFADKNHPVLMAANRNLQDAIALQNDLIRMFKESGYLDRPMPTTPTAPALTTPPQHEIPVKTEIPVAPKADGAEDGSYEEELVLRIEEVPFLHDHTIISQPAGWIYPEDLNPVVPMTMTLELLAESAHRQMPDKKVVALENVAVYKWMNVEVPFINSIRGKKKDAGTYALEIDGHAKGDIVLSDTFPEPPAKYVGHIDLGKEVCKSPTKEEVYGDYMFHGPRYQCAEEILEVSEKGLRARLTKPEGKGSLLDSIGQLIGLYLHLNAEKDNITFPTGMKSLTFYQDFEDQSGEFEYVCVITQLDDDFIVGDVIIKRDGKLWCVCENWQNRRFEFDLRVWDVVKKPWKNLLAEEIKPGLFYFNDRYKRAASYGFIQKRFLNAPERRYQESLMLNKQKNYLISRVALKDAVRSYFEKKGEHDKYCFPVEVFIDHDEAGKPSVRGPFDTAGIEITLAHKGGEAVAMVADKPVGIDIERIEKRGADFLDITFTDSEKKLLAGLDNDEWATRLWTAKEAFAKMKGTGLQGNPRQFEVEKIDGENLYIHGVRIETFRFKDNYIIGYTA